MNACVMMAETKAMAYSRTGAAVTIEETRAILRLGTGFR